MTVLHLPDGVHALLDPLDAALAASLDGRDPDAVAIADVVRALRRAGWSSEWAMVFVRDRLERIAAARDGAIDPTTLERSRVITAIECLRVVVSGPEPAAAEPVVGDAPLPAPVVAPPRRDRADVESRARGFARRERGGASTPRRASGRQLQIRASPPTRPRRG